MLSVTRETLVGHLLECPAVFASYARNDADFVERADRWLSSVEQSLGTLRNPLASLAAAERGRIHAAGDGYRDPEVERRGRSARPAMRAVAALALRDTQEALGRHVADLDAKFDRWREQMAQLLVVANGHAELPPPSEPRHEWLSGVWESLGRTPETRAMYDYLGSALRPTDRLYLLGEVVENLLTARAGTLAATGWFDSAQLAGLREAGVSTVTELLRRGATAAGRNGLRAAAGVDAATVTTWLRRAALSRLATVEAADATLLVAAGVRSVAELARRNPASLQAKLESVHGAGGYPGAPPARERVAEWVAEAKRRTSGS